MTPEPIEAPSEPVESGGGAPSLNKQGNLVILNDGSKHYFPEGTTVDQMHKTLKIAPPKVSVPGENWVDKIRPYVAGGVGATAAGLTTLIPGVGESGIAQIAADTQGYALVDSLMKYLGASPPKSYSEALTDSEKDAAINAVAGKLIGTVFKGLKAFRNSGMPEIYDLAPTASQAMEHFGMRALAQVPRFIEDYGVPVSKAAALDRSAGKGFTQTLAHANSLNGRQAGTNANPQKLYDAIKGQLQLGLETIPEYQPLEATQRTAPYQSIKIRPKTAEYQPIEISPTTARTQPIEINAIDKPSVRPGAKTQIRVSGPVKDVNVPQSYQTRATGPVENVEVPGSYQTIGGATGEAKIPDSYKMEPNGPPQPVPGYVPSNLHVASQEALDMLANGSDHFKVLDDVLENTDKLSKVLKVGALTGSPAMNVKQDLAAYKFMDMVNKATTKDLKGGMRFDTSRLAEMWNDPKMSTNLDLLYGKAGRENISDFFKNIASVQGKQQTAAPLRYLGAGKFLMNMGSLAHAITTGNYIAPATTVGLQLGAGVVGRLLTNPTTARIMVEMSRGGTLGMKPAFAARMIGNALRNKTVGVASSDGTVAEGTIVEDPQTGMLKFQEN